MRRDACIVANDVTLRPIFTLTNIEFFINIVVIMK